MLTHNGRSSVELQRCERLDCSEQEHDKVVFNAV